MCTKHRSDSSSPGLTTFSRDGSLKTYPTPWPGLILSLIAPRMDRLFHFHTLSCFTWSPVLFVSYSSHSQHYPAVMLGPQHLITRPGRVVHLVPQLSCCSDLEKITRHAYWRCCGLTPLTSAKPPRLPRKPLHVLFYSKS